MELEHEALGIPFPDWPERWERFEEALDYLEAVFKQERSTFDGKWYSVDATVTPKPTGLRTIIGGGGEQRTPTLAGARADEYNFFICPADKARQRIDVMRAAAGERPVEATVMGPALVGRTDAEYRERLEAAATRRGVAPEDLESRFDEGGIPVGTPERAAETVAALEEAGVQRIYLQWLDLDDMVGMKETVSIVRDA
jgi:alkanesulfonate monooxygenase SsuD/methylene tetrahydromethanopterin reductase-like flavin-dependent oxidoreductase (luciferase family)